MPRPPFRKSALIACAAALLAAGCAPTVSNHGFAPQLAELQSIEAGQDTRGSVVRRLGRPSAYSSYDGDVWFYVASRVESFAFYRPRVVERTVVAVRFDEDGLVTEVNRYGLEDGRIVDLVTNTTPTLGRELTVLQQIFSNVGRFDASNVLGGQSNVPGGARPR
jgi:outer membrane protein assembly factor BamE (lipoprotein component of BamABCDE complex)